MSKVEVEESKNNGFIYDVLNIPLDATMSEKKLSIVARRIMVLVCPVSVKCRVNERSNPQFDLQSVRILTGDIHTLWLSNTDTSSTNLQLLVATSTAFELTTISNRTILLDPTLVEYDARLSKQISTSVYSEDIRDTNLHTSGSVAVEGYRSAVITINNTLDQDVTIQVQGSLDGSDWYDIGSSFSVTAGNKDYQTFTEAWIYVRITVQCGSSPTSGSLTVKMALRSG